MQSPLRGKVTIRKLLWMQSWDGCFVCWLHFNKALSLNKALLGTSALKYLHRLQHQACTVYFCQFASSPATSTHLCLFLPSLFFSISAFYRSSSDTPLSCTTSYTNPGFSTSSRTTEQFLKSNTSHYFPLYPIHTHSQNSDIFFKQVLNSLHSYLHWGISVKITAKVNIHMYLE